MKGPEFRLPMTTARKIILSLSIGILAGTGVYLLPVSTLYQGAHLGDLLPPLFSLNNFVAGRPVYGGQYFNNTPVTPYPFTMILALYPISLLPLFLAGPVFFGIVSAVFACSLLHDGKPWRLLVLLSPPYILSLYGVQIVPLLCSAYFMQFLLPVACFKPHIGLMLCASGDWKMRYVLATILYLLLCFAVYPSWLLDWLTHGNFSCYEGKAPIFFGAGFLLLASMYKWRDRRSRLLAAMSVLPQRLWYDQLMIFFIPETFPQLCFLLAGSWFSFLVSMIYGWLWQKGMQHSGSWHMVVHFVYIPALFMIFRNELIKIVSRTRERLRSIGLKHW